MIWEWQIWQLIINPNIPILYAFIVSRPPRNI